MSVVYGLCDPGQTVIRTGVYGGSRVEVEEGEPQGTASAQLIHQHGLALLKHVWPEGTTEVKEEKGGRGRKEKEEMKGKVPMRYRQKQQKKSGEQSHEGRDEKGNKKGRGQINGV